MANPKHPLLPQGHDLRLPSTKDVVDRRTLDSSFILIKNRNLVSLENTLGIR